MSEANHENEWPFPPDLEKVLQDTAIPLPERMVYRDTIEEHVQRLIARGQADRVPRYCRQQVADLRGAAAQCRAARRADFTLKVVQRVVIPAATSVGVLLLQAHGFG